MNPRLVVLALAPGAHLVQWVDGAGRALDDVLVVELDAAPRWRAVADVLVTAAGLAALRAVVSRAASTASA